MPEQIYTIAATWDSIAKRGTLETKAGGVRIAHLGMMPLGDPDPAANPEELLLAAVAACFIQTWAIFLGKLKVPIEKPVLDSSCALNEDPAGGFRVTKIDLEPRVPAALWETRRADVEKTLSLAEKYCIVSKAVKASLALTVTPKPV